MESKGGIGRCAGEAESEGRRGTHPFRRTTSRRWRRELGAFIILPDFNLLFLCITFCFALDLQKKRVKKQG